MQVKEGMGWKACYREDRNTYGAEVLFQGSCDLYEINSAVYHSLTKNIGSSEAAALIGTGRRLYAHVNDRCGPPYTIVFDDDYREFCPWADGPGAEKVWSEAMTDAAVELFESEKQNREPRRKKRAAKRKNSGE